MIFNLFQNLMFTIVFNNLLIDLGNKIINYSLYFYSRAEDWIQTKVLPFYLNGDSFGVWETGSDCLSEEILIISCIVYNIVYI